SGIMEALVDLGSYDEAVAVAAELLPPRGQVEDVWNLIWVRSELARILTQRGERAQTVALSEWAVEQTRGGGVSQDTTAVAFQVAAAVRLSIRDAAGAIALLTELEGTAHIRDANYYVTSLPEAVRTALAAGDSALAARLTEGVQ